ncbi:unnamed protein product [Urochloa decumbens]|uniref:Receptor kinase-like protein Xa21 n=1 Tax=Urochloa decumbens TaxID=240449 RepID=A0ABC9E9K4_9POAL
MTCMNVYSVGVVWLLSFFTNFCSLALAIYDETESDRQALICFKSQVSGPAEVFTSWSNASLQFCSWHGVICSTEAPHRVIELNLASEGITGFIPPCIANLTFLTKLQLSNNSFHGGIPSELGLLSQLKDLNLSMNSLAGKIPAELSSCSQLQILGLWNNSLHGQIPSSLSQCMHLQEINLRNNKLQGSIPSALGNLPELQIMVLARNQLNGFIPSSLGSSHFLRFVDLGSNALTGGIPESLVASSSLQVLRLMNNNLSGELPMALFNTSSLEVICLQQNQFIGSIPPVIATSPPVKHLDLGENHLSGTIPSSIGNLSSLLTLRLNQNKLVGSIPESLGNVQTLEIVNLNVNSLSGVVPVTLFKMSSLRRIAMANNSLIGRLPSDIGYMLPNIQGLVLSTNKFEGPIPASLLNAYNLRWLYLQNNMLTGFIPLFGSLPNLEELDLSNNMLEAGNWDFISSLSNCSKLEMLILEGNDLHGNLPSSIGNLSSNMKDLWLRNNKISGPIPPEIGNLVNLNTLFMDYNLFTGSIPSTIGNLHRLVVLALARNNLTGQIPDTIGNLAQLNDLKLDWNNLTGEIPSTIGHCTQLKILNLAHNSLEGSMPSKIFKISSLSEELDLSHNYLSGAIPEEVGNLINLNKLSISNNRLSGEIPSTLGKCVLLEHLQMQRNYFVGSIPQSFMNLESIKEMDISQNNLSGQIPQFLASLHFLRHLNLSFNSFDGVIPTGGIFDNADAVSIEGNSHLCTSVSTGRMPVCSASIERKRKHRFVMLVLEITIPIVAVAMIIFSCLAIIHYRKIMKAKPNMLIFSEHMRSITYKDIVKATDRFSSENLVGSGSFGMVYKGNIDIQEDQVAIKIFNLGICGVQRSFVAECEALRNIRHRNLVKILTVCSSVDYTGAEFKALVFQYMPNGSLEMWLHPKDHAYGKQKILTLIQRINIALDVASAMDYLHNQCSSPLIHCDLKPSNILLDLDMAAYVSDFGLARFLCSRNAHQDCSASLACLKGSIGYIPPEYGMSEEISTRGDVYSFGVLLLEMITGTSPTDEKFSDGTNLHGFVDRAFPKKIHEIIDPAMLQDEVNATETVKTCISPLVRIGLSCSTTSPRERPGMGQVCTEILKIKQALSNLHGESNKLVELKLATDATA